MSLIRHHLCIKKKMYKSQWKIIQDGEIFLRLNFLKYLLLYSHLKNNFYFLKCSKTEKPVNIWIWKKYNSHSFERGAHIFLESNPKLKKLKF